GELAEHSWLKPEKASRARWASGLSLGEALFPAQL
ncbi:hypothetical protein A2U01_0095940, partial [Trifolium medium]|nr:hypothetical protein [Trifolium medium]